MLQGRCVVLILFTIFIWGGIYFVDTTIVFPRVLRIAKKAGVVYLQGCYFIGFPFHL